MADEYPTIDLRVAKLKQSLNVRETEVLNLLIANQNLTMTAAYFCVIATVAGLTPARVAAGMTYASEQFKRTPRATK